ncbi:cholinesterase 1-like isoform X4 [Frankliniella occidentalis]|uniref:Carboxylic ester hydrolase n=1 Tax=Frankliniella occidentalis TaxID=133901 RepID=A0A9C6X3P4_FRAOC|nr:cholinesterase 1-like isoform X4 [Frankliniella occidentalis]
MGPLVVLLSNMWTFRPQSNKKSKADVVAEDDGGWFSSWKLPTLPDLLAFPAATLGWPSGGTADPSQPSQDGCPVVKVKDGFLRGRTLRTEGGTTYYGFRGVPYAKPPIGDLRFKAPQPPEPWLDVRDAGQEGSYCTQPMVKVKVQPRSWSFKDVSAFMATMPTLLRRVGKMFRQSEDCLYLNVYSPELPRGESAPLRPVLFWIHGGGFLVGDGDSDIFGPDYFVDQGIVVVSINYRLGPFGFLSVGTEEAPGNAGMKDQVMALRWVRDNIAVFGGDPGRVCVYGESAGAVAAHLHTLSPLSRGLFHAAIIGSGSALHEWAMSNKGLGTARELAKTLGIEASEPDEVVAALRKESADRLISGVIKMNIDARFIGHELVFLPVVEPPGKDAFLTEEPEDILREGRQADVPIIIGVNNREGGLWLVGNPTTGRQNPTSASEIATLRSRLANEMFLTDEMHSSLTPEKRAECHKEIMEFYFGEKTLTKETMPQFLDLFGDLCFINSLYVCTRLHAANEKTPVYVYYLSYEGKLGFFKRLLKLKIPGMSHGDELGYIFRVTLLPEIPLGPENPDLIFRNRMIKMFTNFVKTGNPTPSESDVGVTWSPSWQPDTARMDYLDIGESLRMRHDPPSERMHFWDGLYRRYLGRTILS